MSMRKEIGKGKDFRQKTSEEIWTTNHVSLGYGGRSERNSGFDSFAILCMGLAAGLDMEGGSG